MFYWLMIMVLLAMWNLADDISGNTAPYPWMRSAIILLLALGVAYRSYYLQRSGEREKMNARVKELEARIVELEKK